METKVSMNWLRRNLRNAYNDVLDECVCTNDDGDYVLIIRDEQKFVEAMQELRSMISTFHCVYDETDPHFSDMSEDCDKIERIENFITGYERT